MSSKSSFFDGSSPVAPRPATLITLQWAEWSKKENRSRNARSVVVFSKDALGVELLVYDYGDQCVCIKRKRIEGFKEFRPWRQPFAVVSRRLKSLGWKVKQSQPAQGGHHVLSH